MWTGNYRFLLRICPYIVYEVAVHGHAWGTYRNKKPSCR